MAGKIINSEDREKILISLLAIVEQATTRRVLINAWRIGKLCFHDGDRRLEVLSNACAYHQEFNLDRKTVEVMKGGKDA